ncbi:MAG: hypothetical protein ACLT64_04950 [Streptococcus salivarius]
MKSERKLAPKFLQVHLENGTIYVEAEKVGEDTTFGKIIELSNKPKIPNPC